MDYFELRGDSYGDFNLQKHVFEILPRNKNAKIMDVGCGLCKHLSRFQELGYHNLKGVDIEPTAVNACREFGIEAEQISDINQYSTSHQNEYDFIIMAHVLEHIKKSKTIDSLRAIRSMLTDNGELYLVVPNAQSNTNCYWAYEDFTHHTLFTTGSLIFVLRAAGFNNIRFIDKECLSGLNPWKKLIKKIFLKIYFLNYYFWNRVTNSQFHSISPNIFSFELKVIAKR